MKNLIHMTLISILLSSEKDILGLIWLSKIKNFCLFFVFSLLFSCHPKKNIENSREIVNYYSGVVMDEGSRKVLPNVSVICLLDSVTKRSALTNKSGYFKISDTMFNKMNIQEKRKLIFTKKGYTSDTVHTAQYPAEYRQRNGPVDNHFIFKDPDTLYLRENVQ